MVAEATVAPVRTIAQAVSFPSLPQLAGYGMRTSLGPARFLPRPGGASAARAARMAMQGRAASFTGS